MHHFGQRLLAEAETLQVDLGARYQGSVTMRVPNAASTPLLPGSESATAKA